MSDKKDQNYNIGTPSGDSDATDFFSANMPGAIGNVNSTAHRVIAQEVGPDNGLNIITTSVSSYDPSIDYRAAGSVDYSNDTIGGFMYGGTDYATTSTPVLKTGLIGDTITIETPKHQINVDELAEFMDIVKKRLLILIPEFEKHKKYPMLKELYDEYKAMEKLLSGPDSNDNNK